MLAEMHTVRRRRQSDIHTVVNDYLDPVRAARSDGVDGSRIKIPRRQIFLPNLDEPSAPCGKLADLLCVADAGDALVGDRVNFGKRE